jgi:hypothetical protein
MILSICFVALVLVVWFKTEAYVEYCRLFRLNRISNHEDYYRKKKDDVSLTYHGYLRQYHNGFRIRLVTCPICIAIWVSTLTAFIMGNIFAMPIHCICGLILFGITYRLLY